MTGEEAGEENIEMVDTGDIGEQAGEVTTQGDESDTVEDLKLNNMEDIVEECLPETTDEQIEHTETEGVDVETGEVSGVEKQVTARRRQPASHGQCSEEEPTEKSTPPQETVLWVVSCGIRGGLAETRKRMEVVAEGQRRAAGHM
ncbi:hypothetical protein PAMP_021659 [Pampus punctatissimus]